MSGTSEKRLMVHQWVDKATDDEVEVFYESLMEETDSGDAGALMAELNRRRDLHLRGISPSLSLEEFKESMVALRKEVNSLG